MSFEILTRAGWDQWCKVNDEVDVEEDSERSFNQNTFFLAKNSFFEKKTMDFVVCCLCVAFKLNKRFSYYHEKLAYTRTNEWVLKFLSALLGSNDVK